MGKITLKEKFLQEREERMSLAFTMSEESEQELKRYLHKRLVIMGEDMARVHFNPTIDEPRMVQYTDATILCLPKKEYISVTMFLENEGFKVKMYSNVDEKNLSEYKQVAINVSLS